MRNLKKDRQYIGQIKIKRQQEKQIHKNVAAQSLKMA
jgi:hypothetical protein